MKWVEIAQSDDPDRIEEELTADTRIGTFMEMSIHIVHGWEKPSTMAEIGIIRERIFRAAGAGRNVNRDIDELDLTPGRYRQLVIWDPEHRELVSLYRFAETSQTLRDFGIAGLRTSSLFEFSRDFRSRYLEHGIELGRSVVNRKAHRAVAGLFAVWKGLGILARELRDIHYFFGNITLPAVMSPGTRDAVVYFLNSFYTSDERAGMVKARHHIKYRYSTDPPPFCREPRLLDKASAKKHLVEYISKQGESVPPILLSYLGAAEDIHFFDTALDTDFGNAWEAALAIPVESLNAKTRQRFLEGYTRQPDGYFSKSESRMIFSY